MAFEQEYANAYNLINQQVQQNNAWSAQMAANNMNFQLDMANTAHQREVADLKAAGLNPILSAHGNGAPVGSGAMASPDTNNTAALTSLLKDLIASNTTIGVANAKAAGGGYGSGSPGSTPKDKDSDSEEGYSPKGTYSWDLKGLVQFFGDIFQGLTGKSEREAAYDMAELAGAHVKNYPEYARVDKGYDGSKPAVTTANGNSEYGAIPHGTVLQWLLNPITNAAKEVRRRRN